MFGVLISHQYPLHIDKWIHKSVMKKADKFVKICWFDMNGFGIEFNTVQIYLGPLVLGVIGPSFLERRTAQDSNHNLILSAAENNIIDHTQKYTIVMEHPFLHPGNSVYLSRKHCHLCFYLSSPDRIGLWAYLFLNDMWHDQREWVGYRRYCFWDIGKESIQIPLFYIVFSVYILLTTL